MKIVFTIDTNTSGGAERVVSVLANWFASQGDQVIIINSDSDSSFYSIDKRVKIIKLGLDKKYRFKFGNVFRLMAKTKKLIKAFRSIKPDAVITFLFHMEMPTIIAGFITKTKVFTSIRNGINAYKKSEMLFRKVTYPKIAGVVFQSKRIAQLEIFKKVKSCVIMNPLSINKDEPINPVNYEYRNNWVISVGRLNAQKNQKLLIDAFCEVADNNDDIELHIFGDGEMKHELHDYIAKTKYSDRIVLEGNLLDAISINRNARMFVLSSDYEGFPNALVEAMAYGIPVISSKFDSGVAEELITEGENGFLFEVGNKNELVTKMEIILAMDSTTYDKIAFKEIKIKDMLDVGKIGNEWYRFIHDANK